MISQEPSIYFTIFSFCLFFSGDQKSNATGQTAPALPPLALPSLRMDRETDTLFFFLSLLPLKPPSVPPDGGQCERSLAQ